MTHAPGGSRDGCRFSFCFPTPVAIDCLLDVNVLDQRVPMRAPRVYDEKTSAASTVHLNVDARTPVIEVYNFNISLIYRMRRVHFLCFRIKVRFASLNVLWSTFCPSKNQGTPITDSTLCKLTRDHPPPSQLSRNIHNSSLKRNWIIYVLCFSA